MDYIDGSIIEPLPSIGYIEKSEKYWRVRLPEDLRVFLMTYGGAKPVKRAFLVGQHEYAIERFLCRLEKASESDLGWYDIDVVFSAISSRLLDDGDMLGTNILPIAALFAGDFVCADFHRDKGNPTICVWNHDESDDYKPVLYPVADSFTEFLDMLH
jgi:hypothetical protein